jgi:Uma2 family endonuclease
MALPYRPFISVEDYLILDNTSKDARYEYLEGELHMLAGGSNDHSRIAANLINMLEQALEESPCLVFTSDVRLKLSETRYVHPDIAVTCDSHDLAEEDTISHPSLVAEVLSPSTEAVDRGKKSIYYRQCQSIQEYLIIDALQIFVELYRREKNIWKIYSYEAGDTIHLECFDLRFPIERLYRKTRLINSLNQQAE